MSKCADAQYKSIAVFPRLFIAFLVAGIICLAGGVYLCKKFKSETWEDGQPVSDTVVLCAKFENDLTTEK